MTNPRVTDNDKDETTVALDGRTLRSWSYANDAERRQKIQQAREYVEGYCDGNDFPADLVTALEKIEQLSKPGQHINLRQAVDILTDIWNAARETLAKVSQS